MKYAWVKKNKLLWPVCVQCCMLKVSVSGYRQHLARLAGLTDGCACGDS